MNKIQKENSGRRRREKEKNGREAKNWSKTGERERKKERSVRCEWEESEELREVE